MQKELALKLVRELVHAECDATKKGRVTKRERKAIAYVLRALTGEAPSEAEISDCLP